MFCERLLRDGEADKVAVIAPHELPTLPRSWDDDLRPLQQDEGQPAAEPGPRDRCGGVQGCQGATAEPFS